jgi:hypothetical protein
MSVFTSYVIAGISDVSNLRLIPIVLENFLNNGELFDGNFIPPTSYIFTVIHSLRNLSSWLPVRQ